MNWQDKTVFVVDPDSSFRDAVCDVVSNLGIAVQAYDSAESFLQDENDRRGCLICEEQLPGIGGLGLQTHLAANLNPLPLVLVATSPSAALTVQAMKNGAVSVLEKPCNDDQIRSAVEDALLADDRRRRLYARRAEYEARVASLTTQERAVLDAIVDGKPNKLIATELDVSLRTIEARRHNVFEKMRSNSVADLVRLVVEAEMTAQV